MEMTKELFKQIWLEDGFYDGGKDIELKFISGKIDDSWRHGNYMTTVYEFDGKYYEVLYTTSGDGEWNGIREDKFELFEVDVRDIVVTKKETYNHKEIG